MHAQHVVLLSKADRQLAGKERVIARLRAGRQADRDRARTAEIAAAAAERRAERAIESMGREQYALSRKNADLTGALRVARGDAQLAQQRLDDLAADLVKLHDAAEQREHAERQLPTQKILRQWEALAARIARQASGPGALPLAGLEQEVVSTWQQLRQQNPTSTPSARTQAAHPAAAPRRKNR